MCKNKMRNSPDKVYFYVPQDETLRKQWCKSMRREDVSPTSCLYCCEDPFIIEHDSENYIQYKIMALQEGQKITPRLKKGVGTHIFQCQKDKPSREIMGAIKRKRKALIEEALFESAFNQHDTHKIGESSPYDYYEYNMKSLTWSQYKKCN